MLTKLKQLINRLKYAPRAAKQTLLNIKDTSKDFFGYLYIYWFAVPVCLVVHAVCATYIYFRYMTRLSMYERKANDNGRRCQRLMHFLSFGAVSDE